MPRVSFNNVLEVETFDPHPHLLLITELAAQLEINIDNEILMLACDPLLVLWSHCKLGEVGEPRWVVAESGMKDTVSHNKASFDNLMGRKKVEWLVELAIHVAWAMDEVINGKNMQVQGIRYDLVM